MYLEHFECARPVAPLLHWSGEEPGSLRKLTNDTLSTSMEHL